MNEITLLREACKGTDDCGICLFVCPKEIFVTSNEPNQAGYLPPQLKGEEACTGCMTCMISCPDFALVVEKGGMDERGPQDG